MDKHNVILILVSSKWLIPYSGGSSNSCFHLFIFLFRSAKFSLYLVAKLHLNHCKASTLFFSSSISIDHFFYFRSSHESSTWWFIKDLYSFSKCSSRFFSKKLKLSSYCNPECNSFFRIIGGGIMSFLIIWVHVFMIHMLSRLGYFKSINLFVGIVLGYISPKTFPKDCC